MKKMNFLAAVCCMLAVFTACEKNEPTDNTNVNAWCGSSGIVSDPTGSENGYGYVDLGLSVKWATCNVGASKPEEYGDYFAWGETETKETYYWGYYKWKDNGLTKYCTDSDYGKNGFVDNKIILDPEDDAARANWGGSWRMPTKDECQELINNCTYTRTYDYNGTGVEGVVITSNINGNSIFLPVAGYRNNDDLCYAYCCHYWSSSLSTDNSWGQDYAWSMDDFPGGIYAHLHLEYDGSRCVGRSVRAVCE